MKAISILALLLTAWALQAADTTKIPNFRADVCRTSWTFKGPDRTVTFEPGGKATLSDDKATKYKWSVKSQADRIVELEWTYFGDHRKLVFTFAEDMKSAKMEGGDKHWDSKPVEKKK